MEDEITLTTEQKMAKMEAQGVDRDQKLEAIMAYITQQNAQSCNPDPIPTISAQTEFHKTVRRARPANPPEFTVLFHSIRRSRVTGLPKSTNCHDCHGNFGQVTKPIFNLRNHFKMAPKFPGYTRKTKIQHI
jgi:hypothetical protein